MLPNINYKKPTLLFSCRYFKSLRSILIIFSISFALLLTKPVFDREKISAAETAPSSIEVTQPTNTKQYIQVKDTLSLPNERVAINGSGEPGAKITITALHNQKSLFQAVTTVNQAGRWQIILPAFDTERPDQLLIDPERDHLW